MMDEIMDEVLMYKLPYSGPEVEERLSRLDTLNADDFDISEELQELYGLYGDDANVGAVLEKLPQRAVLTLNEDISAVQPGSGEVTYIFNFPSTTTFKDTTGKFSFTQNEPSRIYATVSVRALISIYGFFTRGRSNCSLSLQKNGMDIADSSTITYSSTNANGTWVSVATNRANIEYIAIDMQAGDYLSLKGVASGGAGDTYILSKIRIILREAI